MASPPERKRFTRSQRSRETPEGHQRGVPGDCLGGPEGQPGGGPGGHDHRQGQPGVDAHPNAGGAVRAVHPGVDGPQPTLPHQGEQADLRGGIADGPASEATAQPNGGPIRGVFCTVMCEFFIEPPPDTQQTERQGERGLWVVVVLLSVGSSLLPPRPPPPRAYHFTCLRLCLSGLEGQFCNCSGRS